MNNGYKDELPKRRENGSRKRQELNTIPIQRSRSRQVKEKSRKKRTVITLIIAECIALTCIFSYAFFLKRWNLIQRPNFEINNVKNDDLSIETVEKMKGYWTIAVFGVDSASTGVNGRGTSILKNANADVNMLCNINMDTGEIKLVSVYRDTYLNINDKNSYNKLNRAYFDGGPEQAVKTLNKNLDLNITDYVTFNWKAVADAINILGGIDLEITKAEFKQINGFITETVKGTGIPSEHLKKAGMNHLDGVQAVAYGRLRLMDSDFARTERQRKVIQLAFDKAKKADFSVLNNIMVTVFPQVATSVDLEDLRLVARNVTKYHIGETSGFPTDRSDADMGKKGLCVIPETLESNVIKLHDFLFGGEEYSPSSSVTTISKKITSDTKINKNSGSSKKTESTSSQKQSTKSTEKATDESKKNSIPESNGDLIDEGGSGSQTTTKKPGGEAGGWETWPTDEFGNAYDPAWGGTTSQEGNTGPGATTGRESTIIGPTSAEPGAGGASNTVPHSTGANVPTTAANPTNPTAPTTKATVPYETPATGPGGTASPTVEPTKGNQFNNNSEGPGPSSTGPGIIIGAPDSNP